MLSSVPVDFDTADMGQSFQVARRHTPVSQIKVAAYDLGVEIERLSLERPERLLRNVYREAMRIVIERHELRQSDRPALNEALFNNWQRGSELLAALEQHSHRTAARKAVRAKHYLSLGGSHIDDSRVPEAETYHNSRLELF